MASIEKRGDSYRIIVSCGYDNNDKKLVEKMTWSPPPEMTKKQVAKELERQAYEFEQKVKNGVYLDGEKITFAEFSARWIHDYAEKQLKTKSVDWYKSMLDDRIIPAIGHLKLAKIQPHHLISFMTELQQRGVNRDFKYRAKDGLLEKVKEHKLTGSAIGVHPNTLRNAKLGRAVNAYTTKCIAQALGVREKDIFDIVGNDRGLSAQTITHYLRCISSVLSTAVEWQIITTNPCERVKAPKRDQHKIKFMEIDDAQKIIQKAMLVDDIRVKTAILLFVFTGIRKGELAALEWDDFNFETSTIKVVRNMQYIRGHGLVTNSTKTVSGERIISISTLLLDQLKEYKSWQNECRLKMGSTWIDRNRLFTSWNGDYISPSTIYHWIKDFLIKNGHGDMTVHGLRHTNISLLISQGVDIVTTSRRAGHSRPSTTVNIYAHALLKPDQDAAIKLENLLNPIKKSI